MRILEQNSGSISIQFTIDELNIINNCFNETLEALSSEEVLIRVGYEVNEIRTLLKDVNKILSTMNKNAL